MELFYEKEKSKIQKGYNKRRSSTESSLAKHDMLAVECYCLSKLESQCPQSSTLFQSDSTGKLGFHEFKLLWNNIKKWQASTSDLQPLEACILHSFLLQITLAESCFQQKNNRKVVFFSMKCEALLNCLG